MTHLIVSLAVRVVVFGAALWLAMRWFKGVKVTPRKALPLVAGVFALMNVGLYWLLSGALNLVTLWTMFLIVPFVANAALLWATDRLLKQFRIDGLITLAKTAAIVTICHIGLRLTGL